MDDNLTQMADLYVGGATLAEIGKLYGISGHTVSRRLREAGFHTRDKAAAASGPLNHSWRGGRVTARGGYIKVWIAPNEYRWEHRLILEKQLGRKLAKNELPHHRNSIPGDNRPENLKLVTTNTHRQEHIITSWSRKYDCCQGCGTTERKHASGGFCSRCNQYNRTVKARGYETQKAPDGHRILSEEHRLKLSQASLRRYNKTQSPCLTTQTCPDDTAERALP